MTDNPYQPPLSGDPMPPRPKLWNPQAAVSWSLLFSPVFGAIIHAQNWRTLGDPKMARANILWAAGNAILIAVLVFVPAIEIPAKLNMYVGLGILLAWFFALGKKQVLAVKSMGPPPESYEKKSWTRPLLAGGAAIAALIVAVVMIFKAAIGPDAVAAQLKPLVEKAWRDHPGVKEARVDTITFSSTENYHYKGTVTGNIDGETVSVPIAVKVDSSSGEMEWKTGE